MGQAVEVQAEPIKSSPQSPPATDSSPNPDIPVVVTLDDHQATDSRLVGAKAANLARLQHGGFAIPDGFCVTTAAYTILTQGRDVAELIERLALADSSEGDTLAARAAQLRDYLRQRSFPPAVRRAVAAALEAAGTALARSCGIGPCPGR